MELLRELTDLQRQNGYLDNSMLREFCSRKRVPLYRVEGLVSFYPQLRRTRRPRISIEVCRDVCCAMAGCHQQTQQLHERLQGNSDFEVREVSCLGRCEDAPAVAVNGVPSAAAESHDVVCLEMEDGPGNRRGFVSLQTRPPVTSPDTQRRWECDPYRDASEHYGTVRSLVDSGSDFASVCTDRLKKAGLRGMGGAGFPVGMKWELVARESSDSKYVVCNADESEPGTFKDRVILEELPHLVIEGMVLAGLAVGAEQGILFLRHEYAKERRILESALAVARDSGVLGVNAAGSGKRFDIEIFVSPGGYILGEETALLEALEDKRGEPRNKPPYPGTSGLWGKPTLIHNVESLALATAIVNRGAEWWTAQGRDGFSGLKFVCVSGDVEQPGVYEVAIGTTVAELIELAGGMKGKKKLKAFLPGGASSNFLSSEHVATPLDLDAMAQVGSMLGTGAVIVFSEDRDLFALATNLVRFFRNESCGKCVPCRTGIEEAVRLLEAVQAGESASSELAQLSEIGETLQQTSICGLGQIALAPILSLMERFPEEVPTS